MKMLKVLMFLMISFLADAQGEGGVILVDSENMEMQKAFSKARAGLDNFIYRATDQRKDVELYGAYIKVVEGETTEYLWVSDFKKYDETHFMGVLITKPEMTKQFEEGATIGFLKEDIYDWQIYNMKTDTLEGAYTFNVLEKKNE